MQQIERFEDLIAEESFWAWYFKTDASAAARWDAWIKENPGKKALVDEACLFLQQFNCTENLLPQEQLTTAEQTLLARIGSAGETETQVIPFWRTTIRKWWWAAAAVIVLFAGIAIFKPSPGEKPAFSTTYGEIVKKQLPDGSDVIVNANSNVSYKQNWKEGEDREVWIQGEAFFTVKKTPAKDRFIVHTSKFDIIVTGTQFNVVDRGNRVNVLLKEGSVIIKSKSGEEIAMKPGDFIEFNNDKLAQKLINPDQAIAWKEKRLMFENTPLTEAAGMIREIYGVTIEFNDAEMEARRLTGIMPNNNLEVLLQSIEATLECRIVKEGNKITIYDKVTQ